MNQENQRGAVSKEEEAEREGLHIFPDNAKGASLVKKSILGPLSEEEEQLLMNLVQEKQYSPEVADLFKKHGEHDKFSSLVEVNHGIFVQVSKEEQNKKIWTYGLGKCNATLTLAEKDDGAREVILTHFFPDKIREQAGELSELLSRVSKKEVKKVKTIILSLGKKNGENEELVIERMKDAEILATIIRSQLPSTEIVLIPYPEFNHRLSGKKDQGVFIADVPGSSQGKATYKTWFTSGDLS